MICLHTASAEKYTRNAALGNAGYITIHVVPI